MNNVAESLWLMYKDRIVECPCWIANNWEYHLVSLSVWIFEKWWIFDEIFYRFHIILRSQHSMSPTVKMDSFSVVLFWQSRNSTGTHSRLFSMVSLASYFWSEGKNIFSPCRMHIVKVTDYLLVLTRDSEYFIIITFYGWNSLFPISGSVPNIVFKFCFVHTVAVWKIIVLKMFFSLK